jgi:hypothetical protein
MRLAHNRALFAVANNQLFYLKGKVTVEGLVQSPFIAAVLAKLSILGGTMQSMLMTCMSIIGNIRENPRLTSLAH